MESVWAWAQNPIATNKTTNSFFTGKSLRAQVTHFLKKYLVKKSLVRYETSVDLRKLRSNGEDHNTGRRSHASGLENG